jgi:hypothetical protein
LKKEKNLRQKHQKDPFSLKMRHLFASFITMLFGIDKEAWPVCRSTIIIINKQQQSWSIKGGHAVNQ